MRMHPSRPARAQRGITGLETAIILIAFVVVASVFAFTVLSTGIFASERSKETVFAGIKEAQSTLEPRGSVVAYKGLLSDATQTIFKLTFTLSNAVAGEPVDLTPPYTSNASGTDPDISSGAKYVTIVSYNDKNQFISDVPWSVTYLGDDDGDNLLTAAIGETGAVVTSDPLPSVVADNKQLERLLQNLIGNAIKYQDTAVQIVHVSAERRSDEWCFRVQDNGIGIDPRFSARIFEMFQRLHSRDEYSGTGIGLALPKRIVERRGGRIWVASQPGKGSTFFFTIPDRVPQEA